MINKAIYPWQNDQWQKLWLAKKTNRLPHALLLSGISGMGQTAFADNFTRALFCRQPQAEGTFCDNGCQPCRLISGRVHPNVLWIEPGKEDQAIKIDQIRQATEFVFQSALAGVYQVLIIHPAHQMNANAANALLKTLEEPASGSIIILISDQADRLPATILSRCQHMAFCCPDKNEALDWLKKELKEEPEDHVLLLKLANGAPLAARDLAHNGLLKIRQEVISILCAKQIDPIKTIAKMQNINLLQFLDFMMTWIIDLLRLQLGGNQESISNSDYLNQLTDLTSQYKPEKMIQFMDYVQTLRRQIYAGINLNKQLLMEEVLIRWVRG